MFIVGTCIYHNILLDDSCMRKDNTITFPNNNNYLYSKVTALYCWSIYGYFRYGHTVVSQNSLVNQIILTSLILLDIQQENSAEMRIACIHKITTFTMNLKMSTNLAMF